MPKITEELPSQNLNVSNWKLPQNVQLADPQYNERSAIDMLIGVELFYELQSIGQIKMDNNQPRLQKTLFGWIVAGKCGSSAQIQGVQSHTSINLDASSQKFRKRTGGDYTPRTSTNNKHVGRQVVENIQRNRNHRFNHKPAKKDDHQPAEKATLNSEKPITKIKVDLKMGRLSRWQHMFQNYWKRWSAEYLSQLQQTASKTSGIHNIPINSLGFVREDYFAPIQWMLEPMMKLTQEG